MNSKLSNSRADILVTEPDETALLLVETKRRNIDQAMLRQIEDFAAAVRPAFVMAVDPTQILVAPAHDGRPEWNHSATLSTPAILGQYSDTVNFDRVEGFYLESLVEAWLRDFTQAWKSARPAGYDQLESIGLAERLRGSEIHAEAHL